MYGWTLVCLSMLMTYNSVCLLMFRHGIVLMRVYVCHRAGWLTWFAAVN